MPKAYPAWQYVLAAYAFLSGGLLMTVGGLLSLRTGDSPVVVAVYVVLGPILFVIGLGYAMRALRRDTGPSEPSSPR